MAKICMCVCSKTNNSSSSSCDYRKSVTKTISPSSSQSFRTWCRDYVTFGQCRAIIREMRICWIYYRRYRIYLPSKLCKSLSWKKYSGNFGNFFLFSLFFLRFLDQLFHLLAGHWTVEINHRILFWLKFFSPSFVAVVLIAYAVNMLQCIVWSATWWKNRGWDNEKCGRLRVGGWKLLRKYWWINIYKHFIPSTLFLWLNKGIFEYKLKRFFDPYEKKKMESKGKKRWKSKDFFFFENKNKLILVFLIIIINLPKFNVSINITNS